MARGGERRVVGSVLRAERVWYDRQSAFSDTCGKFDQFVGDDG